MQRLLSKYGHIRAEDIEECSKGSIDAFERGELSEEYMERLVRFVSINFQLKQHGLASLPTLSGKVEEAPLTAPTPINLPEECKDIGLSEREYGAIQGNYGTILGISVNKEAYRNLMQKCKTKRALSLQYSEEKTKTFMVKKIKALATSTIKRNQRNMIMATVKTIANGNVFKHSFIKS
jgi:hypothetical protein